MATERGKVEFSQVELLAQNQALSEELSQCQKDKDFVWNLWKQLQSEEPDMTNLISSVVEREQAKSDAKDLKVLNILQQKDQQIQVLQEIGADLQTQLKESNNRLSDLLIQQSTWNEQAIKLNEESKRLRDDVTHKNQLLSQKEEQMEDAASNLKLTISQLQKTNEGMIEENEDLKRTVESFKRVDQQKNNEIELLNGDLTQKTSELSIARRDLLHEKKSYEDICCKEGELETNLSELKQELNAKITELDDLQDNLEMRNGQLKDKLQTINEQNDVIEQQQFDINDLRKEVSENHNLSKHVSEQSKLIRNLENLQDETQQVLSNQQATHQQEIGSLQKSISELTKKALKQQHLCDKLMVENKKSKQKLQDQNKIITAKEAIINEMAEVNGRLKHVTNNSQSSSFKLHCSRCSDLEEELSKCQQNYDLVVNSYNEKCKQLVNVSYHEESFDAMETSSVKHTMMKSKLQYETIQRLQALVHSMDVELQTTRDAHKQRLKRYKLLQENYNLVLEQLSTYEEGGSTRTSIVEKSTSRASHNSLRHEKSQSVWNELEHYRNEYGKLNKDRPKLIEELDEFRVKASFDETTINDLKVKLTELRQLVSIKEEESSKKADVSSQCIALEKQLDIWKEKFSDKNDALKRLEQKYADHVTNEQQEHQHEKRLLLVELQTLQSKLDCKAGIDTGTQTIVSAHQKDDDSKQLLDKMNEIMNVVQSDKLTMGRSDPHPTTDLSTSSTQTSPTQTSPRKVHFKQHNKSSQTDETSDETTPEFDDFRTEKSKRKHKLTNDMQRLLLLKSDLHHENRSLKKRVVTLENQVAQLREVKNSSSKELIALHDANEKLKGELVSTLHKLQATREILQERTSELEMRSKELQTLLDQQSNEKQTSADVAVEMKALQSRLKETAIKSTQATVLLTSAQHETALLEQKLKQSQDRILKLEKTVFQKKTLIGELKEKYKDVKDKMDDGVGSKDTLAKKLKAVSERETKNRTYIDQLKSKVDMLTNDKISIGDTLKRVELELNNKSRLLEESQRLCKNAESAITEMEQTAYEQLKCQHDGFSGKEKVIKTRYDKLVSKVNELKISITNLFDALLSQIHSNRSTLLKKHKATLKKRQETFLEEKAKSLACSILNMSTSDLEDFMKDEVLMEGTIKKFEDNDVRAKLDAILKKESNFGKILSLFLLDLVNYNFQLLKEVHSNGF